MITKSDQNTEKVLSEIPNHLQFNQDVVLRDIKRLGGLHSWYKYLSHPSDAVFDSINGFYFIPQIGEQPRYDFNKQVEDKKGIHWHLARKESIGEYDVKLQEIVKKYPIILNRCFGCCGDQMEYDRLIDLLMTSAKKMCLEIDPLWIK